MDKRIQRLLLGVPAVFLVIIAAIGFAFRLELLSLASLQKKYDGVYTMRYYGDYGFDEFLQTGAASDSDIEAFVTRRLLKGLPIQLHITDAACTAFVARDENGAVLFSRNFDFEYAPFMQLHTKPDTGYASVSTVNLSFAGYSKEHLPSSGISFANFLTLAAPFLPFDGMNEKGVSMALLAVPVVQMKNDPEKVTLNTTTAIRLVLDKAASVAEAVDLLRHYNIYFSGGINCHFLLADASGKSVLIEYYDGGLQVIESGSSCQIASNFVAYNGVNIGEGFTEFERYEKVRDALQKKNNCITMQECRSLLNEIGVYNGAIDKLQWSVVYNLNNKTGSIWPYRDMTRIWDFACSK